MAELTPVTFAVQEVKGLKQLEENLRLLRELFGVKTGGIVIRALRAGAVLIRDDARRRAPHVPEGFIPRGAAFRGRGKRRKAISRSWLGRTILVSNIVEHAIPTDSPLAGGKPTVLVRVRNRGYTRTSTGAIRFNNPGSSPGWWYWLEYGTSKRPATPFMRPAFESQKNAALEAFRKTAEAEVHAIFSKLYGKAA